MRNTLFFLFALSGFTGLIYESIWSHYLKLFLGHAAYAQALVLAIFMGGMALGAWLASRLLGKFTNLLIAYALIEGLIGFFGLGFHAAFQATLSLSYDTIIPALGSTHAVQTYKWTISTLLILPQSILLGMTFPVMSNGIIRLYPVTPGGTLGMLYFTNSIGAAIGVLVSGFVLLAAMGLPGTLLFAAIVNITLAIVVYAMAKGREKPPISVTREKPGSGFLSLILIAAFITGAASFIYEISWLRMLSMVLGASTHSFELMLSAFITGLALGGLWIRRRIDRLQNPFLTAGMIQVIMGFFAIATLPLYNQTFDLMGFLLDALDHNESGYVLFGLSSHFIALLVMLPATFCAGMTLPLFTYILLHNGHGEKSVGEVYASNTLGAIAGVVFTILAGLPLLGLKGVMIFGATLDIMLGLVFMLLSGRKRVAYGMIAVSLGILSGSLAFAELNVYKMSSGVYRTGLVSHGENVKVLYQKDGRTSTVHVLTQPGGRTAILTNGKSDAAINVSDNDVIADDEPTMALLAAIPLAFKPDSTRVANIGMGSGMTAHTLLAWPEIERVDTIEIEPAMVEGARYFLPRVEKVFEDPRSHIIIEDAKT
ncbi:MAG TPA: spermidine synthase, partial [Gammaproteobacteria bacterium]|nr:spermidine synthase [Gammaproteobacteria bacterium]